MNILFCSVGRRSRLLIDLKKSDSQVNILATDCSPYAPALYFSDQPFVSPRVDDDSYLQYILKTCKENEVRAITTLIDPEIEILAKNRSHFIDIGVLPLCPSYDTSLLCFDKFKMYEFLKKNNINTVLTYDNLESFKVGLESKEIEFPVFIKPRAGSASVGAEKISDLTQLEEKLENNAQADYIIQELMIGDDLDVDVYVDCISNKPVAAFSKRKIETKIGGASKTISFKDNALFDFIKEIVPKFEFYGPIDMDFFYKNGQYYLSEINPRFGGAYPHAYGSGIDFYKMIINNINGIKNTENFGNYEDDIVMMMYDDVVIKPKSELA
ncbi:ATP-grasp domain-containing protein [Psychrobacter sp. CAL346-MNA-CIBAN-0220]|uniref:ATP-grasp domain-containing protein n=1 Tax=Psychrobacter sp. CAL346-MNA-CIBAN-0220 TaxID=3140457 RepID=UPI003320474F